MSSANSVRIAIIPETTYGETPATGNFLTTRFTSESLTGSPETTESQQIRTDRMSSGQIVTSLTVGGDINFELASGPAIDELIRCAMMKNAWITSTPVTVDLTLDTVAKTLTRDSGDWNGEAVVGDILTLTDFADNRNNTQIQVAEISSATVIKYVGPDALVDEVGSGTTFQVADKLDIGTDKPSLSVEKTFLDLTDKAINYRGEYVGGMNIKAEYGAIVNGTFSLSGNDYQDVDAAGDFMSDGRTITPPATSNSINGSIDMPFVASSATGVLAEADFCIQSIGIDLQNNLTGQSCIGKAAPKDYNAGTALPGITLGAYLSDSSWSLISNKLTQVPFAIGFSVKNNDGGYGFYLPAIQVSFDDPSSGGQNQDVMLDMTGQAKVGANGESSLTVYRY